MLINLFLINVAIVLIWDYFNAPNDILSALFSSFTKGRITTIELKRPFGCSLCMTFWCSLIYLIVDLMLTGCTFYGILLAFALSAINAFLTKFVFYTIQTVDNTFSKLFILLERLVNKI